MKKVKIMLLSLALLAIVGGALAFKAKFTNTWCVTNAYSDFAGPGGTVRYYCSFVDLGGIGITTTTCGAVSIANITTDPVGILKACTTVTNGGLFPCDKLCDILTSVKPNGGQ